MKKILIATLGICFPLLVEAQTEPTVTVISSQYIANLNPSLSCNATAAVSNICNGTSFCAFLVTNSLCGDPDPSSTKRLETTYQCTGGSPQETISQQNQQQILWCFPS